MFSLGAMIKIKVIWVVKTCDAAPIFRYSLKHSPYRKIVSKQSSGTYDLRPCTNTEYDNPLTKHLIKFNLDKISTKPVQYFLRWSMSMQSDK